MLSISSNGSRLSNAMRAAGIMRRSLLEAVFHARGRAAFGGALFDKPLMRWTLLEMLLDTEGGRSAAYYAAWTADADPAKLPMAAAMAKAWTSEAGRSTASAAIQLHGGIGFTWEHPAQLYLKRAKAASVAYGTPGAHRADLAALVNLPSPDA